MNCLEGESDIYDERKYDYISKLEKRNEELLDKISDSKYYSDLKIAIDNNYVRKFYLSCKL